jgi:hypothetical protein
LASIDPMSEVTEREAREIRFWEQSEHESPHSNSIETIFQKAAEARVFMEKVRAFSSLFSQAASILELGGGQCWASCIVKRLYPQARVTATDISPAAVASLNKWEHIYKVKVDEVGACRAFNTFPMLHSILSLPMPPRTISLGIAELSPNWRAF